MEIKEAVALLEARDRKIGEELSQRIAALWPNLSEEQRAAIATQVSVDGMTALLDRLDAGQGATIKYRVEVLNTISTSIEIEASSPDDAIEQARVAPLPDPPADWHSLDDWQFIVYDAANPDRELARED